MIMSRNDRLKSILNDYKECLGALEQSYRPELFTEFILSEKS